MIRRKLILFVCLTFILASTSYGLVIGNWEDSSGDGWSDWSSGLPITDGNTAPNTEYVFGATVGATLGSQSLQVIKTGMGDSYGQSLAISLNPAQKTAFMANDTFEIDYSVAAGTAGGWNEIYAIYMNAPGPTWTDVGGGSPVYHYDFWDGSAERTTTVSIDYTSFRDAITDTAYIQIILALNSGGGQPNFYFDNAQLVPEPATVCLFGLGALTLVRRRKK